jgi:hypothetical protein
MNMLKTNNREQGRSDARWPILLTASAGVLALLPVSLEIFWGTMPFAVIGGLTAVIVLALLLLPAVPFVLASRERRRKRGEAATLSRAIDDRQDRP